MLTSWTQAMIIYTLYTECYSYWLNLQKEKKRKQKLHEQYQDVIGWQVYNGATNTWAVLLAQTGRGLTQTPTLILYW